MFRSWFTGARDEQPQPQQRTRMTVVTKETHFEVIGGGAKPISGDDGHGRQAMALTRPRLPMEIVTEIVFVAARLILEEQESSQDASPSSSALRLASVNTLAYDAIVGNLLLRELILTGVEQVEAFAASLRNNRRLARLAAVGGKVKTLAVVQASGNGRRRRRLQVAAAAEDSKGDSEQRRDSLYDVRLRDKTFAKGILIPLRSCILPLTARSLHRLHVESLPTALLPSTGVSRPARSGLGGSGLSLLASSRSLQEVSFALSPWGGASIQDVFATPQLPPMPGAGPTLITTPWSQLHSLQVHGSEGFRFCLPSAIALSSLPALRHLALVMPSSSIGGSGGGGLAESLRVLVALTAGRLETLLVVGHDMEKWSGWSGPYGVALRSLKLPTAAKRSEGAEGQPKRVALRVKHVTVRLRRRTPSHSREEEGEQQQQQQPLTAPVVVQHPSYFRSWIVARTAEGTQWEWSSRAAEMEEATRSEDEGKSDWAWLRSSSSIRPDSGSVSERLTADEAFAVEWRCDEWEVPVEEAEEGQRGQGEGAGAEGAVGYRQTMLGDDLDERRREVLAAA